MEIRLNLGRVCAGDRLEGLVRLGTEAADCREIVVCLVRRATAGDRTTTDSRELLRRSRSSPGQSVEGEIRFVAETADEPPTYHGRVLQIDHSVVARAQLTDGRELEAQTGYVLHANALTAPPTEGAERHSGRLVGVALILFGALLIIASSAELGATIAGSINALIGVALLTGDVRRHWWGRVAVDFEPNRPVLGSSFAVRAALRPRRSFILRRAEATLEAEEIIDVPDPDGHTTRSERVVELRSTIFEGNQSIQAGTLFPLHAIMAIPADAPPAFRCPAGRVEWQVRVRLEGNRAPWERVFPLVVVAACAGEDRSHSHR